MIRETLLRLEQAMRDLRDARRAEDAARAEQKMATQRLSEAVREAMAADDRVDAVRLDLQLELANEASSSTYPVPPVPPAHCLRL